jgi:hypothetical protein
MYKPRTNRNHMAGRNNAAEGINRISRRIILRQLWDFYEDDDHIQEQDSDLDDDSSSDSLAESTNTDDECLLASPEANLGELWEWLDSEGDKECARIDRSSEYVHCEGDAGRPNTLDHGLNTAVLERIRQGKGPRRAKFEDLLAPLRLDIDAKPRKNKKIHKQTYGDMKGVLVDWNKHVADPGDDLKARDALLAAMRGRISFLKKIAVHRSTADAYDDTSGKLVHAIHVYRPETAAFHTKDPSDLLIIILAHIGFIKPDIDDELKHLIFHALVMERNYNARKFNRNFIRGQEKKILGAKQSGDQQAVKKYEGRLRDWEYGLFLKSGNKLIEKIKFARRGVEQNCFKGMRQLRILQAAQAIALAEKTTKLDSLSRDHLVTSMWLADAQNDCNAADADLERTVAERLEDLDRYFDVAERRVDDMRRDSRVRILTRARRHGGHDLADRTRAERNCIVKDRMTDHGTTQMMSDAVVAVIDVRSKAGDMLEQVIDINVLLAAMMDAAKASYRAYDELALFIEHGEEEEEGTTERRMSGSEAARPTVEPTAVVVDETKVMADSKAVVVEELEITRSPTLGVIDDSAQEHEDYMKEIGLWERRKAWQRSQ